MKKIILIICPVLVGILTFIMLNAFLDKKIEYMINTKDLNQINNEYESISKNKGVKFNNYVNKNENVVIQATSELEVPVPQVPAKFFQAHGMNKVTTIGRGACQNLTFLTMAGSQDNDNNPNKKLALVVSMQWFYGKDGASQDGFQANFSPFQFYKVLGNEKISIEHKKEYAKRIDHMLRGNTEFLPERVYAQLYTKENTVGKIISKVFEPYYFLRKNLLSLKDKGLFYKRLKLLPVKQECEIKDIDWDEEYKKAEQEGQSLCTNDFGVNDDFYNRNKSKVDSVKKEIKNRDLENSKEFDDYKLYLNVCKDLGLNPYIILMPANGKWYDELDLKSEERERFYTKVQKMAEDMGSEVLNLNEEEYTPYFMYDAVHFGWKGWLKVDEELYKHFEGK